MAIVMTYGLAALLPGPKDRATVLEATANVAPFGSESRLRINFQLRLPSRICALPDEDVGT